MQPTLKEELLLLVVVTQDITTQDWLYAKLAL